MIYRAIHSVLRSIVQGYRKHCFLDRIRSSEKSLVLRGPVYLNASDVTIGKNVVLYEGVSLYGAGKIVIEDNCKIGKDTCLYASIGGGIHIKKNTQIAAQCYIIDCDHGIKKDVCIADQPLISESVVIGEDVWLAAGVKVLKGVTIGDGAVVGAGGVVTKNIEENFIAVGVPAKPFRRRV